jgi:hypothetical protein
MSARRDPGFIAAEEDTGGAHPIRVSGQDAKLNVDAMVQERRTAADWVQGWARRQGRRTSRLQLLQASSEHSFCFTRCIRSLSV